jgi:RNA polymerase sigma factor (sigma-70 family)
MVAGNDIASERNPPPMPANILAPMRPPVATGSHAALSGDLNSLFAAARPRLIRLARLRGATDEQAEDIAQETLLTAWRSLDHLRATSRFDAWLDGICRNVSRRYARDEAPEATLDTASADLAESAQPLWSATDSADDPLETLSRRELITLVDSALGHLRETAREALELCYLAELSPREAAERIGLTANAMEARLSRARRDLRATLDGPLRAHAVEFGLALSPADEHGWRDTRLWCHLCGRNSLQGILEEAPDGGGRLVMRCPQCWREQGLIETNIPSMSALRGMKSFRPAFKRLITTAASSLVPALKGEGPCVTCGAPVRAYVTLSDELQQIGEWRTNYPGHYYVVAQCPRCGVAASGAAGIASLGDPVLRAFMTERDRWIIEPETLIEYAGSPAIHFGLHDLASGDRVGFIAGARDLTLRAIIER